MLGGESFLVNPFRLDRLRVWVVQWGHSRSVGGTLMSIRLFAVLVLLCSVGFAVEPLPRSSRRGARRARREGGRRVVRGMQNGEVRMQSAGR
jgi:hypothetical protein